VGCGAAPGSRCARLASERWAKRLIRAASTRLVMAKPWRGALPSSQDLHLRVLLSSRAPQAVAPSGPVAALFATFEEGLRDRPLAFLTLLLELAFVAVVRVLVVLLAVRRRVGLSVADASGFGRPRPSPRL
jgi:hypothetical protein